MWVNDLLFVLMSVALIAMMVLALVVKINSRNRVKPPQNESPAQPVTEPRTKVKREPAKVTVETIREPEPLPTAIALQGELPQEAEPALEQVPVLTSELDMVDSEETQPIIEPPEEPITEPTVEPMILVPAVEPSSPPVSEQHEPAPAEADLRRETESKFFDLRYELAPQSVAKEEPDILDGSPVVEDEEEEEEPLPGVVTCPHCKSSVPQTLYCIYCGNTLTAKPTSAKQS